MSTYDTPDIYGRMDFLKGRCITDNPYKDTEARKLWEEGYLKARSDYGEAYWKAQRALAASIERK